jgi:hypothetical protein
MFRTSSSRLTGGSSSAQQVEPLVWRELQLHGALVHCLQGIHRPVQVMHTPLAKIFLLFLALTVAVPESSAKRTGGGRSVGRQSSAAARSRPALPPSSLPPRVSPAPVQRTPPGTPPNAARQNLPPDAPERTIPRQASSPWGGFLGGALLGLGLGSLLGDRDRDTDAVNQAEGNSGTGSAASGAGEEQAAQAPGQAQERGFGGMWWLGILALAALYLVRRARRRGHRR